MLAKGNWKGRQVLPAQWIQQSVISSQPFYRDYGLLWWLYKPRVAPPMGYDVFSAVGYQGQFITVFPAARLFVVRLHRVEDTKDPARLQKIYWENFIDRVGALPAP